ncbi:MAG: hypothetical protein AB1586_02980 [Pseudomonadota bacterium]
MSRTPIAAISYDGVERRLVAQRKALRYERPVPPAQAATTAI